MPISEHDFTQACYELYSRWSKLSKQSDWEDVKVLQDHGKIYLRITKRLPSTPQPTSNLQNESEILEPDTESLLPPSTPKPTISLHNDILLSPTYRVPVLYITPNTPLPPQTDIPSLLIPSPYRSQIQHVGVMGALSMTEHPVSGCPAYFLHPCRTEEAMRVVCPAAEEGSVEPLEYLCLWLGIMGGSVGLYLPLELARDYRGREGGD